MKKSEGGSGGKRGHSGMTHWDLTENVKAQARRDRRNNDDEIIAEQLDETEGCTVCISNFMRCSRHRLP